ncbi:MAG TPA: hypothetical protein VK400_11785 [Pyrinomonadaceae bacterium]|nr:hypothetical protein [Pyrinomonadaceae bacterium]
MRKLFNLGTFATILGLILAFGSIDAAAQKRKPVIRKKPVVKRTTAVVRAPALYRVDTGTNIRVRMNNTLSSKTARVGDRFTTTVTEPVYSTDGVVVIPVGSTVTGRVDTVRAAAKGGKPGEIGVSFVSVRLPNGTTRAINGSLTDLDTKNAKSDNESTASGDRMKHRKVIFIGGGAGGGAVLGGAVGGGKGALIGGIIGGIAGAIAENRTKGEEAEVRSGSEFGVYLNQSFSMRKWAEPIN